MVGGSVGQVTDNPQMFMDGWSKVVLTQAHNNK